MDGEGLRAELCARIYAGLTSTERGKYKTPAGLLPVVDDLLKRSIGMGSPYENGATRIMLDDTPFSVTRFRDWLLTLSPELWQLFPRSKRRQSD